MMKKKIINLVIIVAFAMMLLVMYYWFHAQMRNDIVMEDTGILLESKASYEHSSEGAQLTGIYSNDHELQYLCVDIYGVLGSVTLEYTFLEDKIIYVRHEIVYEQPFYIDGNLKIEEVNRRKYVINEKEMYDISDEDKVIKMDEEDRSKEKERIQNYINEMSAEEE